MAMQMRFARLLCFTSLLLLLSTAGCSRSSKASMILGKWELTEDENEGMVVIGGKKQQLKKEIVSKFTAAQKAELAGMLDRVFAEFGSDGKYIVTNRSVGQEFFKEGTYKVDGANLLVTVDGKEESYIVKNGTSSELVLERGKAILKFK